MPLQEQVNSSLKSASNFCNTKQVSMMPGSSCAWMILKESLHHVYIFCYKMLAVKNNMPTKQQSNFKFNIYTISLSKQKFLLQNFLNSDEGKLFSTCSIALHPRRTCAKVTLVYYLYVFHNHLNQICMILHNHSLNILNSQILKIPDIQF